jgi:hypothetical protein
MEKKPKNIPSPYNFPGTPIFRDTTALPFAAGGPLNDRDINGKLLNSAYASPLGNMFKYGGFGEDQGTFDYARSNYASQPGNSYKDGGPVNNSGPRVDSTPSLSDYQMKAKMAYEAAMGNKAAQRMLSLNPKTYDFGNGDYGTHYMSSIDNYAVPELQDKGETQLTNVGAFPPPSDEDFKFQTPEEADYFATHYKTVAPMMTRQYKDGGQFQGNYSLPEDSYRQGGNNLHDSVYASSPQQYPAVYNLGGNLNDRQQMYMPLDHVTRNGGSILSMSNTPQIEGEGKDLVYEGGGTLYTYAGRPGAKYQKDSQGNWLINTNEGKEFTPIKDPTGKRAALLNKQATVYRDPNKYKKTYDPLLDNPSIAADNTRDVTADKALAAVQNAAYMASPEYKAKQKAEKEAQAKFEKEQWANYNKMSLGEKVLDRTNAALNQPLLMASNALMGEQAYIPGMAEGLGGEGINYDKYLKATGQSRGLSVNDVFNTVNPGNWGGHAGREYGEGNYAQGATELGLGLLGLKGAPLMGNQLAKSSANKLINIEKKLPQSSFINEIIASKTPGRQETLREAENWTKDWVNHPATQEKIINSYKEGLKLPNEHSVFGKVADSPTAKHNLEEAIKFSSGYDPSGRLQEYPLLNQFVEYPQLNNPNIHKGNLGVNYTHHDTPGEFIKIENSFIPNGPFSPPPAPSFDPSYPNALATTPAFNRHGTWVSRTLSPENRLSTGVHELGHDWLKAKTLKLTDQEKVIKDAIDYDRINALKKEYPDNNEYFDYLAKPTEVHARLMEARKYFNLSPNDVISPEQADDMLNEIYHGRTPIDEYFPQVIKDSEAAAKLFNKAWGVVPAAGVAGGAALANPWQEKPKGL